MVGDVNPREGNEDEEKRIQDKKECPHPRRREFFERDVDEKAQDGDKVHSVSARKGIMRVVIGMQDEQDERVFGTYPIDEHADEGTQRANQWNENEQRQRLTAQAEKEDDEDDEGIQEEGLRGRAGLPGKVHQHIEPGRADGLERARDGRVKGKVRRGLGEEGKDDEREERDE